MGKTCGDVVDINELVKMLNRDNARMRLAGCNLAMAALRVIKDYDGWHRLSLAVAEWMKAVADEGDRGKGKEERDES